MAVRFKRSRMEWSGPDRRRSAVIFFVAAAVLSFLTSNEQISTETMGTMDTVESKATEKTGTVHAVRSKEANRRNRTDGADVGTAWNDTSPSMQLALKFDKSSNIANYTWETATSLRWIPPKHLPHLTRRDMVQLFAHENTLWLGDSTARQDYHTLYWLLRETNPSSSMDLGSLDFAEATPEHKTILGQYINMNTYGQDPSNFWCRARRETRDNSYFANVGMVGDQTQCLVPGETNKAIPPLASTGKLDYAIARKECFDAVRKGMMDRKTLLQNLDYSVIVISIGPFQFHTNNHQCRERPAQDIVDDMLEFLRDEIAGPERTVIWKLHGPGTASVTDSDADQELAGAVRRWFDKHHTQTDKTTANHGGMELADFRYAVRERTYEPHRLGGDHPMHWGLEARLLSIDLVARIIARKTGREAAGTRH